MAGEMIPALALAGGAAVLLWWGVPPLRRGVRLYRRGERVRGTVVAFRGGPDDDGLRPVVEFADRAGVVRRVWLAQGTGPAVGRTVRLVYPPDDPEGAEALSVTLLIGLPMCCVAAGTAAAATAIGVATGLIELG